MPNKEKENKVETSLIETIKNDYSELNIYEQEYLKNIAIYRDQIKAIKETRKSLSMPQLSTNELASAEVTRLSTNKTLNRAVMELKKSFNDQVQMIISNKMATTGEDVLAKWAVLSKDLNMIVSLKRDINVIEGWMADAMATGDQQKWLILGTQKDNKMRMLDKLQESSRKDAQMINELAGGKEQKAVMKVGSLNINLGNQTIKPNTTSREYADVIENAVPEEFINIDDL